LLDENTVKKNRKKKCNEGDNTTKKRQQIQNRDYENIVETHKTLNKKIKIYDRLRARRIETKKKIKN
jgi:hypothetical protein